MIFPGTKVLRKFLRFCLTCSGKCGKMDKIAWAYRNDVNFHTMVDLMRDMIRKYQFIPSEFKQAAILAAQLEERYLYD